MFLDQNCALEGVVFGEAWSQGRRLKNRVRRVKMSVFRFTKWILDGTTVRDLKPENEVMIRIHSKTVLATFATFYLLFSIFCYLLFTVIYLRFLKRLTPLETRLVATNLDPRSQKRYLEP